MVVIKLNSLIKSVKMTVSGRVQGVGFRYATIQLARSLKISGWVRNNRDGSVEIVASGYEENLNKFISQVKKSPTPYGKVNHITVNYITNFDYDGFDVKY
ncbi:acylphosphatase [Lentilactobacillus kisonensis DSM 19906 = JCM 15041]|uniref:Acylphosphatase n=2 Tax=Lentilactobacillus kisonensis TaxID=481722 RepID=H1LGI3_9LACO|nr:acylphosphatase [Lentilactobacillus kisonensis F0435]KRL23507.1 acylphosphatase [Lentilactobacillus kisonensis DSM 19906 = JCM 15041]